MSKVLVAVRIRPQSDRESLKGSQTAVVASGQTLQVHNVKLESQKSELADSRCRMKAFAFDRIYWSADPASPDFATQEMIYNDLGLEVLSSTFSGYNACLFAYGQTGSGKTYTMMGDENDLGLIPRICQGLFSRVNDTAEEDASRNRKITVTVSYMEIYKEKVCDLLQLSTSSKEGNRQHLKVREHPQNGPYVEGLSRHAVINNEGIQSLILKGNNGRTIAATRIHEKSSRSHAIFTIYFTKASIDKRFPSKMTSKINMVDLAGSERADATSNFDKARQKEGSIINKSLTTLGGVIKALAKRSMLHFWDGANTLSQDNQTSRQSVGSSLHGGRRRSIFIPYRDSVLTWLLKDSLGGNAKTIMIATVSPSDLCYSETVNTLHYAQGAKAIINKPVVNEDPTARLIRDLQEEIARLQNLLKSHSILNPKDQQLSKSVDVQVGHSDFSSQLDLEIAEKLEENQRKADELTRTFFDQCSVEQPLLEGGDLSIKSLNRSNSFGVFVESKLPHLVHMGDDLLNTGIMLYQLKDGETRIGNEDGEATVDIVLNSTEILAEHCIFLNYNNEVTLQPYPGALVKVNERHVTKPIRLTQGDLILLGHDDMFRYSNPQEAAEIREKRRSQLGGDGRLPGALSRCSSLSSINTSSGVDVESTSDSPLSSFLSRRCSNSDNRHTLEDEEKLQRAYEELERLKEEYELARLALIDKEEELYRTHEANQVEFESKQMNLEALKRKQAEERAEEWKQIEREKAELEELRSKYTQNSEPNESEVESELRRLLLMSQHELEEEFLKRKQEIDKKFRKQLEDVESKKELLKAEEEKFRCEDEAMLEDVNQHTEYTLGLEHKRKKLLYIIEQQEYVFPNKYESPLSRSTSFSETCLYDTDVETSGKPCYFYTGEPSLTDSEFVSKVSNNTGNDLKKVSPRDLTRRLSWDLPSRCRENADALRIEVLSKSLADFRPSTQDLLRSPRSLTPDGRSHVAKLTFMNKDIGRSSSYPALTELTDSCKCTENLLRRQNIFCGGPRKCSSVKNLASVPELLNEDFDEVPVSGKYSASAQNLNQLNPVLVASDPLTNNMRKSTLQTGRNCRSNLSSSCTALPSTGRTKGRPDRSDSARNPSRVSSVSDSKKTTKLSSDLRPTHNKDLASSVVTARVKNELGSVSQTLLTGKRSGAYGKKESTVPSDKSISGGGDRTNASNEKIPPSPRSKPEEKASQKGRDFGKKKKVPTATLR